MVFFIILFIIIYLLITGMDRYFYATISNVLDINGFNSETILKSLGYYNESIFTNRLYGILIALIISIFIYGIYFLFKRRRDKELNLKIRELEKDLASI